ncbi:MAG: UPF0104 family protein [Symploca sp. SIO3C6]|nr:UPF0104 family protein [Symploca sp. SIO3C6]
MYSTLKFNISDLKPYLRWFILGGTIFFLAKALKDHWQEVLAIRIIGPGWTYLTLACAVTLCAHICSGWVWSWILQGLNQPVRGLWAVRVYLITNIAKYLPGNVWHFYGRIRSAQAVGVPLLSASMSVLMEPLLMSAAALLLALACTPKLNLGIQLPILTFVLVGLHPQALNRLLQYTAKLKNKTKIKPTSEKTIVRVKSYPILPLIGELVFVGLRGAGFLMVVLAFHPLEPVEIPLLLSAFSLSWVVGLVIPGAPGGIGVFEAVAIALLDEPLSAGVVLSVIAMYRLINTMAEASGAGLAWLTQQGQIAPFSKSSSQKPQG